MDVLGWRGLFVSSTIFVLILPASRNDERRERSWYGSFVGCRPERYRSDENRIIRQDPWRTQQNKKDFLRLARNNYGLPGKSRPHQPTKYLLSFEDALRTHFTHPQF